MSSNILNSFPEFAWMFEETAGNKMMRGVSMSEIIKERKDNLEVAKKQAESEIKKVEKLETEMINAAKKKVDEIKLDASDRILEMKQINLNSNKLIKVQFKDKKSRMGLFQEQIKYERIMADNNIDIEFKTDASIKLKEINRLLKESMISCRSMGLIK